jgi:hypothetical protein
MFDKLRRRVQATSATAKLATATLPSATPPAELIELVKRQGSIHARLDLKTAQLASLAARPLGWTNTLPVVLRFAEDEPSQIQPRHVLSLPPGRAAGAPPWHRWPQ